jgi:hypothetical protein
MADTYSVRSGTSDRAQSVRPGTARCDEFSREDIPPMLPEDNGKPTV